MPADHRLRLHDSQLSAPSLRPEPPHPEPKDAIPVVQARFGLAAKEHLELMWQDQVLERKVLAGTTAINKDAQQRQEEAHHRRGSISGQGRQGVHDPDRLLPPFSRAAGPGQATDLGQAPRSPRKGAARSPRARGGSGERCRDRGRRPAGCGAQVSASRLKTVSIEGARSVSRTASTGFLARGL